MTERITGQQARRIAAEASGLIGIKPSGIAGSLAALHQTGGVQIDTISVVERAHHHILWSRAEGYDRSHIGILESNPRRAIEYWTHAAAYLPIEDYRFCLPRMERIKSRGHHWFRADPAAIDYVRSRISAEGPLRAQDFSEPMKGERGWWDWKPAKVALEYLFHSGELIALTRRGFQKVYELAERALSADLDKSYPSPAEHAARHIDRAIQALGVFSRDEIAYMREDGIEGIDAELDARREAGTLIEIQIEGEDSLGKARSKPRLRYATRETIDRVATLRPANLLARVSTLSPFDPLIIDRRRTARLFAFDYQLECYAPEAKRHFGYFSLPLLFVDDAGDCSFVGLLDAKADRKDGRLIARRLALFPSSTERRSPAAFARTVALELLRFAEFNKTPRVEIERLESDGRIAASLKAALARECRGA